MSQPRQDGDLADAERLAALLDEWEQLSASLAVKAERAKESLRATQRLVELIETMKGTNQHDDE